MNRLDMRFISSMSWVTCGQDKGVPAKGSISLEEINLSRQKQNYQIICLINHGIFPPNMYSNAFANATRRLIG